MPWPDDGCSFCSPSGSALFSWALFRLLPECSSESLGPGSTSWTWMGTRHLCSMIWMALCRSTLAPISLRTTIGWFDTRTASTYQTGEGPSAVGAMHRWGCHPKPLASSLSHSHDKDSLSMSRQFYAGPRTMQTVSSLLFLPSLPFHRIFSQHTVLGPSHPVLAFH